MTFTSSIFKGLTLNFRYCAQSTPSLTQVGSSSTSANEAVENNIANKPTSRLPRLKNTDFIPCSFLFQAVFCMPAGADGPVTITLDAKIGDCLIFNAQGASAARLS